LKGPPLMSICPGKLRRHIVRRPSSSSVTRFTVWLASFGNALAGPGRADEAHHLDLRVVCEYLTNHRSGGSQWSQGKLEM
jgi:hypothetical protein